jgi:hypothetical protein
MMIRSMAIVALAFLGAGCVGTVVTYPSGWAPIAPQPECAAIVGTYRDEGERAPGGTGGGFLRFTQLVPYSEVAFSGPYVTLSFPEVDVLLIKAGRERRLPFKEGQVACDDGKLQLRRSDRGPTMYGLLRSHETVALARSTDGWLIAEWDRGEWLSFVLFIPAYERTVEWYRFAPVAQPSRPRR